MKGAIRTSHRLDVHIHVSIRAPVKGAIGASRIKRRVEKGLTLEKLNPSSTTSLCEGLEETLTPHRLNVPEELRRGLRSTNLIESAISDPALNLLVG